MLLLRSAGPVGDHPRPEPPLTVMSLDVAHVGTTVARNEPHSIRQAGAGRGSADHDGAGAVALELAVLVVTGVLHLGRVVVAHRFSLVSLAKASPALGSTDAVDKKRIK